MVITKGQPIVLGEDKIMSYPAGSHAQGFLAFIFAVKDEGKRRMAALFGSILLLNSGTTDDGLQTHLRVIDQFKRASTQAKVDVELQKHPLFRQLAIKLAKLQNPNPFIVGQASYARYLDVMSACMQAEIDRRAHR